MTRRRRTYSGPGIAAGSFLARGVTSHGNTCSCAYCAPINAAAENTRRKDAVTRGALELRTAREIAERARIDIGATPTWDPALDALREAIAALDKAIALADSLVRRLP